MSPALRLMVAPLPAPIEIEVPAPAKFTVVAVALSRLKVVQVVVTSHPFTARSPSIVTSLSNVPSPLTRRVSCKVAVPYTSMFPGLLNVVLPLSVCSVEVWP